jgi:hypothetical protein
MADINYESYANQDGVIVEDREVSPENPLQFSDVLKFSNCTNFRVSRARIMGGKEDCIDINRGQRGLIEETTLVPIGNFAMTIKGGFESLHLRDVVLIRQGKEVSIDLGNWSDQAPWKMTKGVVLQGVISQDGQPVTCRVMWAQKPKVIGGNVKVKDWRIQAFFYFAFKSVLRLFKK